VLFYCLISFLQLAAFCEQFIKEMCYVMLCYDFEKHAQATILEENTEWYLVNLGMSVRLGYYDKTQSYISLQMNVTSPWRQLLTWLYSIKPHQIASCSSFIENLFRSYVTAMMANAWIFLLIACIFSSFLCVCLFRIFTVCCHLSY